METNKYISYDNLTTFLDNLKNVFATQTEVDSKALQSDLDVIESLALANKKAIEANASAINAMQVNIDALAAKIKANEENLANFVAVSLQEINALFEKYI